MSDQTLFPAPDLKMTQKILLHAAEILDAGWCRGDLCQTPRHNTKDPTIGQIGVDRFCMAGALMRARQDIYGASGYEPRPTVEYHKACGLMQAQMPESFHWRTDGALVPGRVSIPYFNDKLCESAEQAAGIFRKAAEGLA